MRGATFFHAVAALAALAAGSLAACARARPVDGRPDAHAPPLTTAEKKAIEVNMREIAAALGVECMYCHPAEPNYRAESENKGVARLMMRRFEAGLEHEDGSRLLCRDCHSGRAKFLGDRDDVSRIKEVMKGFTARLRRAGGDNLRCEHCHMGPDGKPAARFLRVSADPRSVVLGGGFGAVAPGGASAPLLGWPGMPSCCKECVEFLADYLDHALPEPDARAFEEHLRQCPPCVAFVDTYRKTSSICRERLAVDMPPEVSLSIVAFLRTRIRE